MKKLQGLIAYVSDPLLNQEEKRNVIEKYLLSFFLHLSRGCLLDPSINAKMTIKDAEDIIKYWVDEDLWIHLKIEKEKYTK